MVAPVRTNEDTVERVVDHLKRVCRNTGLELALQVGSVIIHHFYDGDVVAWRARGPKTASFRRLAAHPELPMSPGMLYRCAALFELCDRLEAPSRWRNLGASHLRAVLGLPPSLQERLLALANDQRWTVQSLDAEVRKHRSVRELKGGRRPQPALVIGLSKVRQAIERCSDSLDLDADYEAQHLHSSAAAIAQAQESLDKLAAVVSGRIRETTRPAAGLDEEDEYELRYEAQSAPRIALRTHDDDQS